MDIGLPSRQPDLAEDVTSPYAILSGSRTQRWRLIRSAGTQVRRYSDRNGYMISGRFNSFCYWELGNALLPRGKEVEKKWKLDSIWTGPPSHSGHPRLDRGHSATPGRASDIHPLSGCEKYTPTQWAAVVDYDGTPAVPMLGASTVAHTSRDSPSVTALPPDEGVELADVDSLRDGRSMSRHSESEHASMPSEGVTDGLGGSGSQSVRRDGPSD